MMTKSTPLLVLQHVSRTFAIQRGVLQQSVGEVLAVDDVSLAIMRGETLGIVGESGCGKSTLARLIMRLLPLSSGNILLDEHPLWDNTPQWTRTLPQRLQMVFQDPFSSLNPRLRVGVSIGEPLLAAGVSKTERSAKVSDMLKLVGLSAEHAQRYPHEFSGGQRQRIAIARALITHPDCVVCDEAVSALDASVQAQVLNLLKDVQDQFGFTYIFISHDLAVVGHMSDRVAVMYLGRVVELAPRDVLFAAPAHPYTQALLASAPSRTQTVRKPLQGEPPSPMHPPQGCAFHPRCPLAEARCRQERPQLRHLNNNHTVACHLA